MSDLHTCSYHCQRPECIKAQRDELRDKMQAMQGDKESILSDQLRRIRKLLLTLPEDCLGTGVANDCPPWSIRDEVIDGISKALLSAAEEE